MSAADAGIWTGKSSDMYRPGCNARGLHGFRCLSMTGATFLAFTYVGFALLVAGELFVFGGALKPCCLEPRCSCLWSGVI